MKKYSLFIIGLLALHTQAIATPAEMATEHYLASIIDQPQKLQHFMSRMPKGGDLHNHTSGSAFAENMLDYAANDSLCVDRNTFTAYTNNHCQTENLLTTAVKDADFYDSLIDAWSMQHFHAGKESGHDHFFHAFSKFREISHHHNGEIIAEIAERAAEQNELYVETMLTPDGNESGKLGKALGWDADLARLRSNLLAHDFDKIVASMTTYLDTAEATMRGTLGCGTDQAKPGCRITLRYQYQVLREQPPEMVFAQLLAGFEAAGKEKRIVALNLVMPEDGPISMRDYRLHMRMVAFLHDLYPTVHVTLHAGELTTEVVPPQGLKFHINDAVNVAHAERIGHGVDIMNENDYDALLKTMAHQHIMVEINLSSNAGILNIEGARHPLPLYLKYGVPVALSTDDEGVTRDTLSTEYARATAAYQFSYPTLKNLARNSLTYAFLPGTTLWQDDTYHELATPCHGNTPGTKHPSAHCQTFLASSEKATLQWELENRFTVFEHGIGS